MIRIQMQQQYAKLGLEITPPQIELKTTKAEIQLETKAAVVEMHTEPGVLEIDQTPCRRSLGLKNNTDFNADYVEAGRQGALDAIANIVYQGDQMAAIENHDNVIASMAAANSIQEPGELVWARIESPIIHYQPGKVTYNVSRPKINLDYRAGTVENTLHRGTVRGYLLQEPELKIWTTGSRVDVSA